MPRALTSGWEIHSGMTWTEGFGSDLLDAAPSILHAPGLLEQGRHAGGGTAVPRSILGLRQGNWLDRVGEQSHLHGNQLGPQRKTENQKQG